MTKHTLAYALTLVGCLTLVSCNRGCGGNNNTNPGTTSNSPSPVVTATPVATLAHCSIKFHTNDEDKDSDTHVTVTITDDNNVTSCKVDNDFGKFGDNSNSGPFGMPVVNATPKPNVQRGNIRLRIDPNGNDTWRFNFEVDMTFSDGSRLTGAADGLELSQDRREQTFGISGILR